MTTVRPSDRQTVLLFDATCGFCSRTVQFYQRRDRRRTLRFEPLQGEYAATVFARHPDLANVDSMIWIEDAGGLNERVGVRSDAVLRSFAYLGGPWHLLRAGWIVPRAIRDRLYDFVAANRHDISCRL